MFAMDLFLIVRLVFFVQPVFLTSITKALCTILLEMNFVEHAIERAKENQPTAYGILKNGDVNMASGHPNNILKEILVNLTEELTHVNDDSGIKTFMEILFLNSLFVLQHEIWDGPNVPIKYKIYELSDLDRSNSLQSTFDTMIDSFQILPGFQRAIPFNVLMFFKPGTKFSLDELNTPVRYEKVFSSTKFVFLCNGINWAYFDLSKSTLCSFSSSGNELRFADFGNYDVAFVTLSFDPFK